MANKKTNNAHVHKITYTVNTREQALQVEFFPKKNLDRNVLLNGVLSGLQLSMEKLLHDAPVLRPVTPEERDLHMYVFKDQNRDNALYKERKALHDSIAVIFENTLHDIFPDVVYIDSTRMYQQELAFDKTQEEVDEYHTQVKEVTELIMKGDVQ